VSKDVSVNISSPAPTRLRWSLKTQFWAAVIVAILSSACILLISKNNIWIELEIIVSVLFLIALAYFFFLFYYGVRLEKEERYSFTWRTFRLDDSWGDSLGAVDTGGVFTSAAAEAGPLGCIVGLLLDLVVSIFLSVIIAFLIWLGMNIVITGITILFLPLYFLFRHSLRVAVARGRTCRGDFGKSLYYACGITAMNMVWLYLIIFAGHQIARWVIKA